MNQITEVILSRYQAMSASDIFGSPNPTSILFAWQQGGDEEGPRRFVEKMIISDEGLVQTLEHLMSTVESSDRGRFNVLKKENLAAFMDYGRARNRIGTLAAANGDLAARAKRLSVAFDDGSEY